MTERSAAQRLADRRYETKRNKRQIKATLSDAQFHAFQEMKRPGESNQAALIRLLALPDRTE